MGKLGGGGGGRNLENNLFAGKLGTEKEKAIDSNANVNASFFSLKIDGVRWTGYPQPNAFSRIAYKLDIVKPVPLYNGHFLRRRCREWPLWGREKGVM